MPVEVKLPTVLRTHADGQATVGVDGATVTTWSGDWPTVQATEGPTPPGVAQRQVTFRPPVVPGPGEYRSADIAWGGVDFVQSAYNCHYDESVLDVRSVAYDETRKPLVFDASSNARWLFSVKSAKIASMMKTWPKSAS